VPIALGIAFIPSERNTMKISLHPMRDMRPHASAASHWCLRDNIVILCACLPRQARESYDESHSESLQTGSTAELW